MQTTAHQTLPSTFPTSGYASTAYDNRLMNTASMGHQNMHSRTSMSKSQPGEDATTPVSIIRGDYRYSVVVAQQPIRARMCGFGDKDRRPITPPPCVRVVIENVHTGREINYNDIDPTFFILQVDLWDEYGNGEKNVVRHSSSSPAVSISTATTTSFPPPPERPIFTAAQQQMQWNQPPQQIMSGYPHPQYQQPLYSQPQQLPSMYPSNAPPGHFQMSTPYPGQYVQMQQSSPAFPQGFSQSQPPYAQGPQSHGMYTRNLIGSLTVNAFTLTDTDDNVGHWFVLQDLSVRTEGVFRLKMNFVDVGTLSDVSKITSGPKSSGAHNTLNQGKAPVLASVFSAPFQVFSAKKFPGVIESTALSKCFAGQGIKIPIRKEGSKEGKNEDDGDD